jgi:FkbM family methyltransferase
MKRIPGAVLMLEHIRRAFAGSNETIRVHDFDGSLTLDLCLNEHMQSQIFWYGFYSRDIVLALDRLLSPGMVVLDVGANIGEVSLCAAKRVGTKGCVFSFEPMPEIYRTLKKNFSLNHMSQAHPIDIGISDAEGEAPIYRADSMFKDGTQHLGLGTLYPMAGRNTPVKTIRLTTIDAFAASHQLNRVDLIKVDAEGAELKALIGGDQTLRKLKPSVILELQRDSAEASGCSAGEILEYLNHHRYSVFTIGRNAKLHALERNNLKSFQNILCIPPCRKPNHE